MDHVTIMDWESVATIAERLKQTNHPAYEKKLIETVNDLKQYVIGDVAKRGPDAEGSVSVLKMVEEQLHDDLEKVGYEFYKG